MYMNSWDKVSLESYKTKCDKLEKEQKYIITFSSLYDNDRQYTKTIKEQEDLIDTMSDQLVKLKNTIKIKQTTILELEECLRKKDSENEHLKSEVVDFTTVQNLQVQVEELKSVNESLNLSVEELSKARALAKATLRERDELISDQCKKMRFLEEQSEPFYEVKYEKYCALKEIESLKVEVKNLQIENKVLKSGESELSEKIGQMKSQKMIEMIEKEYESNVSKISITSSTLETKNLELVKEIEDKVKCFDEEKRVFENKISKLEKVLAQRVKDFDDVKKELSKRTDKFETYFANLEKENALLKS
ncbi:hypothetical protein Tco_1038642 [Tanacetum coccineum]